MKLPTTIDHLDDVPEELRPYYLEMEDGRFMLDADGVEDVSGLKFALEKERAARKALKAELDAAAMAEPETDTLADISEDDSAPDKIAETDDETPVTEPEDKLATAPEVEVESEPVPAREDPVVEALRHRLETRLIEAEATAAIVAASGVPELLLPVLLPRLEVREDDGVFHVVVRALGDGVEPPANLAALVEELRHSTVYGRAFDGSGKTGSGAPADAAAGGGVAALPASDPLTLGRHLTDIASGRVTVEG